MGYDINKVIDVAKNQVGYLEKASSNSLDSKTSNAGKGKYTKYGQYFDHYSFKEKFVSYYRDSVNGRWVWSLIFVHWCFCQAYGFDQGHKITYYNAANWLRYGKPKEGNKYYTTTGGGGYNKCILGNNAHSNDSRPPKSQSVIPNCVGYAYGRYMEYWELTNCDLPTSNAKLWYDEAGRNGKQNSFRRTQTPEVGSIIVYGAKNPEKCGHVAFVERINPNGDIWLSESNWYSGPSFRNWTATKSGGYRWSDQYPVLGFICMKNIPLDKQSSLKGAKQGYKNAGRFDKNPKIGDQIFLGTDSNLYSTGIVYDVDQDYVYTIEGNVGYSGPENQYKGIPCVSYLKRSRSNKDINGYGHPNYGPQPTTTTRKVVNSGSTGTTTTTTIAPTTTPTTIKPKDPVLKGSTQDQYKLTRDESSEYAFAYNCLTLGCISKYAEVSSWILNASMADDSKKQSMKNLFSHYAYIDNNPKVNNIVWPNSTDALIITKIYGTMGRYNINESKKIDSYSINMASTHNGNMRNFNQGIIDVNTIKEIYRIAKCVYDVDNVWQGSYQR